MAWKVPAHGSSARQAGAVGGGLREGCGASRRPISVAARRERSVAGCAGVGAGGDQAGDAVRERAGLARAGAGDHQQRPGVDAALGADAVLDRGALGGVERGERIMTASCGHRLRRGTRSGAQVGPGKGLDRDHGCKHIQPRRADSRDGGVRSRMGATPTDHRRPAMPPPTQSCRVACSRAA